MPTIDLTNPLGDVCLTVLVFVVGVVVIAVLHTLNRTNRELDITGKPFHIGTRERQSADRSTEKMYNAALARLNDLEGALVSLVEATPAELDRRTQDWLNFVCEGLGSVLSTGVAAYRVAIWTDDNKDPDHLTGLAWFGFDRHAADYEKLERVGTVAGWAIEHRSDHYVPDLEHDPIFRPRRNRVPRYKSMFATPLGREATPWAVLTVDAPKADGLGEERRALIKRFGGLASVGARIARIRMDGATGTIEPRHTVDTTDV